MSETKKKAESDEHEPSAEATADDSRASDNSTSNRLSRFSGIWKDNPDLDEFRKHIDDFRRKVDEVQP